jgi:hypothetical protein
MDRRGASGAEYAGAFRYHSAGGKDIGDQQKPPAFELTCPARIDGDGVAHIATALGNVEARLARSMAVALQ